MLAFLLFTPLLSTFNRCCSLSPKREVCHTLGTGSSPGLWNDFAVAEQCVYPLSYLSRKDAALQKREGKKIGDMGEILSESCRISKIPRSPAREVWLSQPSSHSYGSQTLYPHWIWGPRGLCIPPSATLDTNLWLLFLLGRMSFALTLALDITPLPATCKWTKGTDTSTSFLVVDGRFSCPLVNGRRTLLLPPSLWAVVHLLQGEVVRMPLLLLHGELSLPLYS